MTPATEARIRLAFANLADEIISALEREEQAEQPDRLLSIDAACEALGGVARSTLYRELSAGRMRSVKVAGRRMIPSSAIAEYSARSAGR